MLAAMTDPDNRPRPLPKGGHHDRSREERITEAKAMVRLWERALFRGKADAREQLAFWRAVLTELEGEG